MAEAAPPAPPSRTVGLVTILLTLAGWTVVPLFIKWFTADVDAWTSNGWRYGFAAVLWWPLLAWMALRRRWPRGLLAWAAIPGAFNAAAQVFFTKAFYEIDPGLVAFGLRVQIVAVTIGAALLFPAERRIIRTAGFAAGLTLLLGGTLLTTGQEVDWAALRTGDAATAKIVLGIAYAMLAGIGYACYALAVRRCMTGFGSFQSFAAISQYTAAAMVVLMLALGDRAGAAALEMPGERFFWFLASAVIGIAAGHVLYYFSIARLGVTTSAGVTQLQPFTVGVLSYFVFGEVLSLSQWASGVVAVTGAIVILITQHVLHRRDSRPAAGGPAGTAALEEIDTEDLDELPADHVVAAAAAEVKRPLPGLDPAQPVDSPRGG